MFEHVFSEGAGDEFILDFHHQEIRDAGEYSNAGEL
jgi:hypothetical protein